MEYDKFLVSLYENNGTSLPKIFVEFNKKADKIHVLMNQTNKEKGILFLYSQGHYDCFNNASGNRFILDDKFKFNDAYFLGFFASKKIYYGSHGKITNVEDVKQTFARLKRKVEQDCEKLKNLMFDRNYICDEINEKMFGMKALSFFEHSKKQLFNLFSNCQRAKEIEEIIPESKFVKVGQGEDMLFVGIVYQNQKPFAIGIGFSMEKVSTKLLNENAYQFFYKKDVVSSNSEQKPSKAFFLSFRKATDGDIVWIN